MDSRALRKARRGLKSNCEKRFSFRRDVRFCCGELVSTGGVPKRVDGVPLQEVLPVWCVLMVKGLCLGSHSTSLSVMAPWERTRRAVTLRAVSRNTKLYVQVSKLIDCLRQGVIYSHDVEEPDHDGEDARSNEQPPEGHPQAFLAGGLLIHVAKRVQAQDRHGTS